MKRYSATALMALWTCSCCLAAEKPEAKDGWVRLFNGKNLDGWKAQGLYALSGKLSGHLPGHNGHIARNGHLLPLNRPFSWLGARYVRFSPLSHSFSYISKSLNRQAD